MTRERYLNNLFDAHTKNLNEFKSGIGDFVVCPICLYIIPREAISQKLLTDGHVWPKTVRDSSDVANSMHVLLCSSCNKTAGSHGDRHMQLYELIKKGDETGELFGKRKVQIIKDSNEKPITINANITFHPTNNSFTFTGKVSKKSNWPEGSPEDQEEFRKLIKKREQAKLVIHPFQEFKPELAYAGWITSAYLMAFYYLGYRYILHTSLNPVRDYILQSFEPGADKNLTHPLNESFTLREYKSNYFSDPRLGFIYPNKNNQEKFIQVSYLSHEIRLPFHFSKLVVEWLTNLMPDFTAKFSELQQSGKFITLPLRKAKSKSNLFILDYLLCKPMADR